MMSKKKPFSGLTMTLRDFHGGSIPSELPLPLAPGMTPDNKLVRQNSGARITSPSIGRGFGGERSSLFRQTSGIGVRSFEDKTSFFPNPANIGRNYDEDERNVRHGGYGTDLHSQDRLYKERPLTSSGSLDHHSLSDRSSDGYNKTDVRMSRPSSASYQETCSFSDGVVSSSPISYQRFAIHHRDIRDDRPQITPLLPSSSPPPSKGWKLQQSQPNVWTERQESKTISAKPYSDLPYSDEHSVGQKAQSSAILRLTQASAVEKVSSGRWNSRLFGDQSQTPPPPPSFSKHELSCTRSSPDDNLGQGSTNDLVGRRRNSQGLYTDVERGQSGVTHNSSIDCGRNSNAEPSYETLRGGSSGVFEERPIERSSSLDIGRRGFQNSDSGSRDIYLSERVKSFQPERVGSYSPVEKQEPPQAFASFDPPTISSEIRKVEGISGPILDGKGFHNSERPKLWLLPCSKPLETSPADASFSKDEPENSQQLTYALPHKLLSPDSNSVLTSKASDVAQAKESMEELNQSSERPKLLLKPQTLYSESTLNVGSNKERKSIFGDARPREVVLKERGIDGSDETVLITPGSGGARSNPQARLENSEDEHGRNGRKENSEKQERWRPSNNNSKSPVYGLSREAVVPFSRLVAASSPSPKPQLFAGVYKK